MLWLQLTPEGSPREHNVSNLLLTPGHRTYEYAPVQRKYGGEIHGKQRVHHGKFDSSSSAAFHSLTSELLQTNPSPCSTEVAQKSSSLAASHPLRRSLFFLGTNFLERANIELICKKQSKWITDHKSPRPRGVLKTRDSVFVECALVAECPIASV